MTTMTHEKHNLHGDGDHECEVYHLDPADSGDYWDAVTTVPCPVPGCGQTVVWYEAGYVPGYRVCMRPAAGEAGVFDAESLRHRFFARGDASEPTLVRDACCESEEE